MHSEFTSRGLHTHMISRQYLIPWLVLGAGTASATAGPIVTVITGSQQIGQMDLATGAFSPTGSVPPASPTLNFHLDRPAERCMQRTSQITFTPLTRQLETQRRSGQQEFRAFHLSRFRPILTALSIFTMRIYLMWEEVSTRTSMPERSIPARSSSRR